MFFSLEFLLMYSFKLIAEMRFEINVESFYFIDEDGWNRDE